jgi:hypothetical protein
MSLARRSCVASVKGGTVNVDSLVYCAYVGYRF